MHACGHDNHVAILMRVAELHSGMNSELQGTVKFIFQPAEKGAPTGEEGGAELMLKEGAFDNPKFDAVFGLHVFPFETGKIVYRSGGLMASGDSYKVVIHGRLTHGALPWNGIDPITISSQIISNFQSIVSRQVDLTLTSAIVTVGYIRGGVWVNIIPESVEFGGTIRTFDEATRDSILVRFKRIVTALADANGARATIEMLPGTPVTYNDPALTERMMPSLKRALGADQVMIGQQTTTSEDFSLFQKRAPGVFVFLGVTPKGTDPSKIAPNHSPRFFADEGALVLGVRALSTLAIDYLTMNANSRLDHRGDVDQRLGADILVVPGHLVLEELVVRELALVAEHAVAQRGGALDPAATLLIVGVEQYDGGRGAATVGRMVRVHHCAPHVAVDEAKSDSDQLLGQARDIGHRVD